MTTLFTAAHRRRSKGEETCSGGLVHTIFDVAASLMQRCGEEPICPRAAVTNHGQFYTEPSERQPGLCTKVMSTCQCG